MRLLGWILVLAALLIGPRFRSHVYLILLYSRLWYLLHIGGHLTHFAVVTGSVGAVLVGSVVSPAVLLVFTPISFHDLILRMYSSMFVRLLGVMLGGALLIKGQLAEVVFQLNVIVIVINHVVVVVGSW